MAYFIVCFILLVGFCWFVSWVALTEPDTILYLACLRVHCGLQCAHNQAPEKVEGWLFTEEALARMSSALGEVIIDGIRTNIPLHRRIISDHGFKSAEFDIHYLEKNITNTA